MIIYDKDDIDRLYRKITVIEEGKNAGCWEVNCYKDKNGYSKINVGHKSIFVHRFIYQIFHPNENIDDKVIRHSCDNPRCVCPDHLSSGTMQDNSNDMVNKDHQLKGSRNRRSKLTEEIVEEILNNTLSGYFVSRKEIENYYDVSDAIIRGLVNEKYWKHVTKDYDMVKIRKLLVVNLTEEDVRDIRQRLKNGELGENIAKYYKVSRNAISLIKLNKSHRNII